jgi:hypothetical protein
VHGRRPSFNGPAAVRPCRISFKHSVLRGRVRAAIEFLSGWGVVQRAAERDRELTAGRVRGQAHLVEMGEAHEVLTGHGQPRHQRLGPTGHLDEGRCRWPEHELLAHGTGREFLNMIIKRRNIGAAESANRLAARTVPATRTMAVKVARAERLQSSRSSRHLRRPRRAATPSNGFSLFQSTSIGYERRLCAHPSPRGKHHV